MNLFLVLSDSDVAFSILFMVNLYGLGGIWWFLLGFVAMGALVYLLGVVYFGPRQKFQSVRHIQDMMVQDPGLFIQSMNGKMVTISLDTKVGKHPNQRMVSDLKCDAADRRVLGSLLMEQGFSHMWIIVEKKNMFNCLEMRHGLPLLRMARFGFMAMPSPRDFGGLLNANAMYSFTTGIPQLVISMLLLFLDIVPVDANLLMPLGVTSASLLLSLVNVLFNFPGILSEVEGERAELARLQGKLEGENKQTIQNKEMWLAEEKQKIEIRFEGQTGPADYADKRQALQNVEEDFRNERVELDNRQKERMIDEVGFFHARLAAAKEATQKKNQLHRHKKGSGAASKMDAEMKPYKEKLEKLRSEKAREIDGLDETADNFEEQFDNIEAKYERRLQKVTVRMNQVKAEYSSTTVSAELTVAEI